MRIIKISRASLIISVFVLTFGLAGLIGPSITSAATDPGLGAAASFSVFAQTTITGVSTISGDVGLNGSGAGITALGGGDVAGTIYATDLVAPSESILSATVQANLSTAYTSNIPGQASDGSIGPALDGLTVSTGVYDIGAGRLNGGILTLDGPGIYIFRASSDLISSGSINLINGARACDVFWRVETLATINGSSFVGSILAGTGVHFGSNVTLNGRALAVGGDVTMLNGTISGPTCAAAQGTLHITKHVINDNGGTAVAADFTINATGTNVSTSSFLGSEAGYDITLDAGAYAVTEPIVPTGYSSSGSGNCSGSIAAGETKTCTITNDDIAPQLIVNKIVVNDNGRAKVISDFFLFIDGISVTSGVASTTLIGSHTVSETPESGYTSVIGGNCAANGTITLALGDVKTCTVTNNDIAQISGGGGSGYYYTPLVPPLIDVVKVPSPLALPNGPGLVNYTYTLRNIGMVPVSDIIMVGDSCSPINLISGDINSDAKLDLNETWTYRCSTTLTKTHTNVVTTIGWANGISATDIANATVVVGLPIVAPLIHVTKVPSSLALPAGGGTVTYAYSVTNPGTAPLSNVSISDDKCTGLPGRVVGHPGDINKNDLLESNETWSFTCTTNLTQTTTNIGTVTGFANGLTVTDFAIATVVVAFPGLPNTGIVSDGNNTSRNIIILSVVFAILASSGFVLRKSFVANVFRSK